MRHGTHIPDCACQGDTLKPRISNEHGSATMGSYGTSVPDHVKTKVSNKGESNVVFIRVDIAVNEELLRKIADDIHDQAKTGIIVLPHFCTLLNDVPLHSDDHAEMDTNTNS